MLLVRRSRSCWLTRDAEDIVLPVRYMQKRSARALLGAKLSRNTIATESSLTLSCCFVLACACKKILASRVHGQTFTLRGAELLMIIESGGI
jgi:hypothetical protein